MGTIASNSPWITILSSQSEFVDIGGGESVESSQTFRAEVSPWCPDMQALPFVMNISSDQNEWTHTFGFNCWAPKLEMDSYAVLDANENGYLEAGETAEAEISIINNGHYEASGLSGYLYTDDPQIGVTTNSASFSDIAPGEIATTTAPFTFVVGSECPAPHAFRFNLLLSTGTEYYALQQIDCNVGYQELCELGDNGWTHYTLNEGSDEWHLDDYRAFTPDYA